MTDADLTFIRLFTLLLSYYRITLSCDSLLTLAGANDLKHCMVWYDMVWYGTCYMYCTVLLALGVGGEVDSGFLGCWG